MITGGQGEESATAKRVTMTEAQIKEHLKKRGYPDSVWKDGSEGLVRRWEKFVAEVEMGYWPGCLIDEYWNDLDTRDVIHEVGCDDRVREADERFRIMLTAIEIRHRRRDRKADYDFWNWGYPKNASGFFLEQIQRYILRR